MAMQVAENIEQAARDDRGFGLLRRDLGLDVLHQHPRAVGAASHVVEPWHASMNQCREQPRFVEQLERRTGIVLASGAHGGLQRAQFPALLVVADEADAASAALAQLTHDLEPAGREARPGYGRKRGDAARFHVAARTRTLVSGVRAASGGHERSYCDPHPRDFHARPQGTERPAHQA